MTKKELQAELIRRLKSCDDVLNSYAEYAEHNKISNDFLREWSYAEGRKNALKSALHLVEHLDEGKKA